ncbi:MAG TPA: methyltransferase domain-containing protein [Thermoanaerobaculia bacterium]|nr:methyltransferase domain-containing protein [Thermoanaerobaculia bacterium]
MRDFALSNRLAALYDRRVLQGYVRWKVRTDPAYSAALEALRGRDLPLVDLGCGVGLLAFYLREQGYTAPVIGIDFDRRKIDVARLVAKNYRGVEFRIGDARETLPDGHNVVLLDLLHYFDSASQQKILTNVARVVPPGGAVILRQPIRDQSWRYRLTAGVDSLARTFRWMKAESLNYPTRDEVTAPFEGFTSEIRPLWGRMPYNTYFFVFTRSDTISATARPPG